MKKCPDRWPSVPPVPLVAWEVGDTTAYALKSAEERGNLVLWSRSGCI